jgi:hypothetical protein
LDRVVDQSKAWAGPTESWTLDREKDDCDGDPPSEASQSASIAAMRTGRKVTATTARTSTTVVNRTRMGSHLSGLWRIQLIRRSPGAGIHFVPMHPEDRGIMGESAHDTLLTRHL